MSDTPMAGEVWEYDRQQGDYTLVGVPDAIGHWHATTDTLGVLRNTVVNVNQMHRKPAAPPTDVECWTNWYGDYQGYAHGSPDWCDTIATDNRTWRFDAYGNWVPCQGKTVIGPAVKGRP